MAIQEGVPGINTTEGQEILDEAKGAEAFRGARFQGYDPRQLKEEEQPKAKPVQPTTADGMLEAWYLYQSDGRLSRVRMGGEGETEGVDEGLAASLYVESTPGFRREIVLFAQQRRGEDDPWRHWYGSWPDNRGNLRVFPVGTLSAVEDRAVPNPHYPYL